MTSSTNTLPVFILVGIGLEVIVLIALMVFRLRGWLSADGTVPSAEPARRPLAPRARRSLQPHPAKQPAPPAIRSS